MTAGAEATHTPNRYVTLSAPLRRFGRPVLILPPRRLQVAAHAPHFGFRRHVLLRQDADLETLLPDVSEAQRGLDVVLLHRLILERGLGITAEAVAAEKNVGYEREMAAAVGTVDRGEAQVAFLLNPVRIQQVTDIALGCDVLPQKSTDFYPKLLSGVAMYRVEGRVGGPTEK